MEFSILLLTASSSSLRSSLRSSPCQHLATGKYLMGNRFTSQCQRDSLALSVGPGDELCHFRISPRFRVRQEGSQAYYGDQIQLLNER